MIFALLLGFFALFGLIYVVVLAFAGSPKQTIRRIDPETRKETVEIIESSGPSAGQTAARVVLWLVGGGVFLMVVLLLIVVAMN